MNTNKEQIELSIPSMQSAHCQTRVSNEVKKFEGVQIQKLEAGKLILTLQEEVPVGKVISAIERAGYKVLKDDEDNTSSCSTGCCTH